MRKHDKGLKIKQEKREGMVNGGGIGYDYY
jgi:hypothetical protein